MSALTFTFAEICDPDYLQEHHSQDGKQLIAVGFYEGITKDELVEQIVSEVMDGSDLEDLWAQLPEDDTEAEQLLTEVINQGLTGVSLECPDVDEPEDLVICGYFGWSSNG